MHESVETWLRNVVVDNGLQDMSVLEVGSLNVNGSPRGLFTGPYNGIDKQPGLGVNQVMDANELSYSDGLFEVVLCIEMLEHDPTPWDSLREMRRVIVDNGHLLLTTRGPGFPEHDYGGDFYRFTDQALGFLVELTGFQVTHMMPDPQVSGWFVHARPV